MTKQPKPLFVVFRKEPLMRAIAATGVPPVGLGFVFFFLVSLTLPTWAILSEPQMVEACSVSGQKADQCYVSYSENISWSISIIFLFPFLVSLTLKYYQEIPKLFEFLQKRITEIPENQTELDDFYYRLDRRFNSYWVTGATLGLTISLNLIYFYQILEHQGFSDWITNGELFSSVSTQGRGFTTVGLYAAGIQIVLIYWVLNLLWRGAVLAWGLHEFFNKWNFPVRIQPLHPDRCCGLRKIGDVAMLLNMNLFILGIYISLKVVDKIVIQDSSLGADIGNPIMLGAI